MCTAVSCCAGSHFFGRTLDYDRSFGETIVVTPRNYPFPFRCLPSVPEHHAMIGMALLADGYPLYFDAVNEKGLAAAGLNFPGNAVYRPFTEGKFNITPYELIPFLLGTCDNTEDAREFTKELSLYDRPFRGDLPLTPLHWMVADAEDCFVIEQTADGLHVYDNPVRVLTNNPPFPEQLCRYETSEVLPGGWSSESRFRRAGFMLEHSAAEATPAGNVNRIFRILGAVERTKGCRAADDPDFITQYTSCCDADRGIYYCTTYWNRTVTAVNMHGERLDGDKPVSYTPVREPWILMRNG